MKYTIRYQIADYSGEVVVWAADEEQAIAKAKKQLLKLGPPAPMYYEKYKVLRVEE